MANEPTVFGDPRPTLRAIREGLYRSKRWQWYKATTYIFLSLFAMPLIVYLIWPIYVNLGLGNSAFFWLPAVGCSPYFVSIWIYLGYDWETNHWHRYVKVDKRTWKIGRIEYEEWGPDKRCVVCGTTIMHIDLPY